MLSLWIRNNLTDRALKPLRVQLAKLIPKQTTVIDVGCANGRLLLELNEHIKSGMGIDLNAIMIDHAIQEAKRLPGNRLLFVVGDAIDVIKSVPFKPDVTVCSLCLHEMPHPIAVSVLRNYSRISKKLLIADLFEPDSWLQRQLLHLDERMARHHDRFVAYLNLGGMPGLLHFAGLKEIRTHETGIPGIRIWECDCHGDSLSEPLETL